ncbi:SDR family oxidoreductase [Paraflavitalea speifideaquila]|uniref:SDR family oxidoreductase n=1 Tax=Paraflavitalea speifideaquila TaxID=3076558 RepID=UPI0028EDB061|nr:SDR family oxidoreductase [Paraflavitalea speifideiaquila]
MSTILILGAASDMAMAIAKKYAAEGHAIQLAARNVQRLKALQSDISIRYNTSCTAHEFDALNFNSHQAFFDQLPVKPDITVCVFGYLGENETARTHWAESEKIIHTNYTGAVSILNVVSNYYAAQHKGVIAGISSVAGERGRQSNYIYGSAKAGFTAYLSGLRNRLFHENVHVVSVQPGFVYTRMTENISLPPLLTAQPEAVANTVYKAVAKKKNVVYVKWFWRWIMLIIKRIPEFMFKKLKL